MEYRKDGFHLVSDSLLNEFNKNGLRLHRLIQSMDCASVDAIFYDTIENRTFRAQAPSISLAFSDIYSQWWDSKEHTSGET